VQKGCKYCGVCYSSVGGGGGVRGKGVWRLNELAHGLNFVGVLEEEKFIRLPNEK